MATTAAEKSSTSVPPGQVQSIARAFTVLETVARAEHPVGVTEISEASGVPTGTVYRMARTLTELGYLRKDGRSKYTIGGRVLVLTKASTDYVAALARPHLDELAALFGETVALGTLQDDAIMYLAQAAGRRTIRMFTSLGERIHPHCTAIGKALLADREDAEVQALLRRTGMPRYTDQTITDEQHFLDVLGATRERGYALNEGEQEEGMRCIAIRLPYAAKPLGFSLSAPTARMSDATIAGYLPHLKQKAEQLTDELYEYTSSY